MKIVNNHAIVIIMCAALGACASGPTTFGDRVYAEGESKIAIAEQWDQGKKDASKGESRLSKGHKLVSKGRADLRKGEDLVSSGSITVQTSRTAYETYMQLPQDANNSADVADRAARLKKIAQTWSEGEEQLVDGNELLQRGNERIAEGEEEIELGHQLIDSGREMMRKAEQGYPTNALN